MPSIGYDKGKIEGHKLVIQEILNALSASSPHDDIGECAPQSPPPAVDLQNTATTSASESGRNLLFLCELLRCADCCFFSFNTTAFGHLIRREFVPNELSSLVEAVFAWEDAGDAIHRLSRDDAQTFIDVIDEASQI
jgi:hypothetical protein